MRFVDTNVPLYAIANVEAERAKTQRAKALLAANDLALSVQVMQEFYVQATRPTKPDALSDADAVDYVASLLRFPVQAMTIEVMRAAMATRHRFGISYWNAAIIEAARELGCDVVLSEDLDDGQDYGGITVENPFR